MGRGNRLGEMELNSWEEIKWPRGTKNEVKRSKEVTLRSFYILPKEREDKENRRVMR